MKIRRFAAFCFAVALLLFIQSVPVTSCYAVTVEPGDRDGTVVVAIHSLEPEPLKLISDAIDRLTKE